MPPKNFLSDKIFLVPPNDTHLESSLLVVVMTHTVIYAIHKLDTRVWSKRYYYSSTAMLIAQQPACAVTFVVIIFLIKIQGYRAYVCSLLGSVHCIHFMRYVMVQLRLCADRTAYHIILSWLVIISD